MAEIVLSGRKEEMAANLQEDLCWAVFCDVYNDPIFLTCTHSVCKSCLQQFWRSQGSRECPLCRRRCFKEQYPLHRVLRWDLLPAWRSGSFSRVWDPLQSAQRKTCSFVQRMNSLCVTVGGNQITTFKWGSIWPKGQWYSWWFVVNFGLSLFFMSMIPICICWYKLFWYKTESMLWSGDWM